MQVYAGGSLADFWFSKRGGGGPARSGGQVAQISTGAKSLRYRPRTGRRQRIGKEKPRGARPLDADLLLSASILNLLT